MANILVTGANGQLGSELGKMGFSIIDEVFYTDVDELDITNEEMVNHFVERNEIDTIINCAAYTAVDKAEDDIELATKLNVKAVDNLAKVAKQNDCLLIHISTDYVFGSSDNTPIVETAATNPQSVYGRTKLAGEQAVIDSGCMYIIIRTAWLYSEFGNNFVKTIRRLASEPDRSEIKVVNDQIGSPTYAEDLATAIIKIMEDDNRVENGGIYHFTDEGKCSWYEFASEIVKMSELDCKVVPCTTEEFPSKAVRPKWSVLDKTKIKKRFGVDVPSWKNSLLRCIDTLDKK